MKKLWTDLHSNIHHNQMEELDKWIEHARQMLDFWPIAYYPFRMVKSETGAGLEDLWSEEDIKKDWEILREKVNEINSQGYPMFMGYEWQGAGLDGDHNVFFKDNHQMMEHPMRYSELLETYKGKEAIAIPHHVAYQLNSRGKNWDTHDEKFSPFAEIYSSHGCSENDTGPMDMERHLHMGPRTGQTCYEYGLNKGIHVGCMASGDNHNIPAVYDHGSMCVLAKDNSKEAIWDGMVHRRVYGVSRSRMDIDFEIDGKPMGSVIDAGKYCLTAEIKAGYAIDRVEVLKNNVLDEMIVHSGTWENKKLEEDELFRVKFAVEFGWGPNPRFYKDMLVKEWVGGLETSGKIVSIEKAWNSYGQKLEKVTEHKCEFQMTTYMSTTTGHWMGPSTVVKEGFIFEIEGKKKDKVLLKVDNYEYCFTIEELMESSRILAQYKESIELAKRVYGNVEHYRDDFYWHNAYKVRIRQAVPHRAYEMKFEKKIQMEPGSQYRLRVWLKNGDVAWVSPIFAE
ncbi:MAG: hypothetical protein UCO29_02410 [Blautia hansenii]|nr:hypothetical protein [Blautia hansenii]MEE0655527.1 hypothetical protein [Blautia hansenii]